jgi:hypothetical protein
MREEKSMRCLEWHERARCGAELPLPPMHRRIQFILSMFGRRVLSRPEGNGGCAFIAQDESADGCCMATMMLARQTAARRVIIDS